MPSPNGLTDDLSGFRVEGSEGMSIDTLSGFRVEGSEGYMVMTTLNCGLDKRSARNPPKHQELELLCS